MIISMWWMIGSTLLLCFATNDVTVEPPLKETPNKGQDSEHQNFTFLYNSANTLITSEERNLTIMNRITCPKSYVIQRFHCNTHKLKQSASHVHSLLGGPRRQEGG